MQHKANIRQTMDRQVKYEAYCECGWLGFLRTNKEQAEDDCTIHYINYTPIQELVAK